MPGLFRVQHNIGIAGREYSGVGNIALLQAEQYRTIHVRRAMVEAAEHGEAQPLRDYMNSCVIAARHGTVMVSPFISPIMVFGNIISRRTTYSMPWQKGECSFSVLGSMMQKRNISAVPTALH